MPSQGNVCKFRRFLADVDWNMVDRMCQIENPFSAATTVGHLLCQSSLFTRTSLPSLLALTVVSRKLRSLQFVAVGTDDHDVHSVHARHLRHRHDDNHGVQDEEEVI